ncbi:MAG: cytochrome c [Acidobacteria bacterium]|nr:cytochrome c [Acidobacteriota bacterium]
MRCFLSLLMPVVGLAACVTALAQTPTYKLGTTPSAEEIRAWDISIGPAGKELPPGSGTAKEGAKIYAQKCAQCHGPTGREGPNSRLVGGQGTLTTPDPVRTIGSYWPFATTIWDYTNRAMPPNEEGSLTANEVYALTAFMLYRNGIIQESAVLDAKTLPKINMPNRNNFIPLWPDGKRKPGPFGFYSWGP